MYLNPVIFYVNRYITNTTYVFNEAKGGAARLISILLIMMPSESFLHKYRISMNIKWYRISINFFLLRIKSMKIKNSQLLQYRIHHRNVILHFCYWFKLPPFYYCICYINNGSTIYELYFFPGAVASSKQPGNPKRLWSVFSHWINYFDFER